MSKHIASASIIYPPMQRVNPSVIDLQRFWDKIAYGPWSGCWVWNAATQRAGYGCMFFHGRLHSSHRLAWMFFKGPIPHGEKVLHTCDNPPCCNPDHLFVGTDGDNAADKVAKGRQNKGEKNGGNKITEADMRAVRARRAAGETLTSIAPDYGITFQHVSAIARGVKWRHFA